MRKVFVVVLQAHEQRCNMAPISYVNDSQIMGVYSCPFKAEARMASVKCTRKTDQVYVWEDNVVD
jgi:hypothetical protein